MHRTRPSPRRRLFSAVASAAVALAAMTAAALPARAESSDVARAPAPIAALELTARVVDNDD